MDQAYVIADQFGNPIAICIDENVAEEFRIYSTTKVMRRPLVSSHSALEDLRKSRETPLKRTTAKTETKPKPKRGKGCE